MLTPASRRCPAAVLGWQPTLAGRRHSARIGSSDGYANSEGMSESATDTPAAEVSFPSFSRHLPVTAEAVRFAHEWHDGQQRASDDAPFVIHPLEVGVLLHNAGAPDEVVAAGVLHDVIEDTSVSLPEIGRRFGPRVQELVGAVTDDETIEDKDERKEASRRRVQAVGQDAAMIFAADKVSKVRELRTRISNARHAGQQPPKDAERKLTQYDAGLRMLEQVIPGHPLERQLRFELETLRALPPGVPQATNG